MGWAIFWMLCGRFQALQKPLGHFLSTENSNVGKANETALQIYITITTIDTLAVSPIPENL